MATNGDTLSLALLVVAIASTGSAACGAMVMAALALARRWGADAEPSIEISAALADPTDRFTGQPLFETPAEDPFDDGDTVPAIDVEVLERTDAVA